MDASAHGHPGERRWLAPALLPLGLFVALVWGLNVQDLPWSWSVPWIPSLGIELAFRIDALSAQMLALITGVGTLIFVYAAGYMAHDSRRGRLFAVLSLFMLAMIGAVSADHIIVLFLFWELTSVTSFLLVGFNHEDAKARESARQAMLITLGGGLALLAGLLLLAQITGSWVLSGIVQAMPAHTADPRLSWAIVLVLLGAFTKSAQFPFHFWLPNAMSAPTPVSAYLHSATMVKLGIYLMARLDPAFNELLLWESLLIGVGTVTAVWAAVLALRERDLKRILARSTVSALGTLTLLIGLPSSQAGLAVITFLFAHALYKAPLFMVAGNIDHATGTRVIDKLMGLRRVMPWTALAAVLAGLSMAGLPLAFGFVAKGFIADAKAEADLFVMIGYALVLVNAVAAAVAGVAAIRVFWGPPAGSLAKVREVPFSMLLPPLLLTLVGIEFELFPHLADPLLLAAAQVISPGLDASADYAGVAMKQLLTASAITLLTGLFLFLAWDRIHKQLSEVHWLDRWGPEADYQRFLQGLSRLAAWHARIMQPGRLDIYLRLLLAGGGLMAVYALWQVDLELAIDFEWHAHGWAWLVALTLMVVGALAATLMRKRIAVLMACGLIGYASALLFLFAGAPDLAFTQFSVETVLVVVAAALLPAFALQPATATASPGATVFRLLLAASAGIVSLLILLNFSNTPVDTTLARWFGDNSLSQAMGRNVVNVIIVDFRALDTLGEILVVVFALLAAQPLLQPARDSGLHARLRETSPLLMLLAKPLYLLILAVALWILLRGHNEPGGGFIAGLAAVTASSLLAILVDTRQALRWQLLTPVSMALIGVALAIAAGVIGAMWGPGFLRHLWFGGLSSVMLFDLGVMLAVWGALTGYVYGLLDDPLRLSDDHSRVKS
jgi:multicomponent Na+:H+ antiporter subunit A